MIRPRNTNQRNNVFETTFSVHFECLQPIIPYIASVQIDVRRKCVIAFGTCKSLGNKYQSSVNLQAD